MSIVLLFRASQSSIVNENFLFSDSALIEIIPAVNTLYVCATPPPIKLLQAISPGQTSFANTLIGYNFLVYATDNPPDTVVGTYVNTNAVFNTTMEEQGNQISFIQKNNFEDCVFYPTIALTGSYITMAWLESNVFGRLDLRYGDTPVTTNSLLTNIEPSSIYIRPYTKETRGQDFESNIPFNKISVVDSFNDIFDLNPFETSFNGFTLQLPSLVKSVRFKQTFKISTINIKSLFTTVPTTSFQTGYVLPIPLIGVVLNVYSGNNTQSLVTRQFSNEYGEINFTLLGVGEYLFEIEISGNNIYYQQQIL